MPWLKGSTKRINPAIDKRLKCHYVALTRAKALVCLAIPKSIIDSESKEALEKMGWNIVEI